MIGGYLSFSGFQALAAFRQTVRVWRALPTIEIDVELTDVKLPDGDPWNNYFASRFAWILVDEFQDTTDLQVEMLSLIAAKNRTRFLLVGDPYQSIYRFAGARPDLPVAKGR